MMEDDEAARVEAAGPAARGCAGIVSFLLYGKALYVVIIGFSFVWCLATNEPDSRLILDRGIPARPWNSWKEGRCLNRTIGIDMMPRASCWVVAEAGRSRDEITETVLRAAADLFGKYDVCALRIDLVTVGEAWLGEPTLGTYVFAPGGNWDANTCGPVELDMRPGQTRPLWAAEGSESAGRD
jgi:hypothetical protein